MTDERNIAAITGARGYLGSMIGRSLAAAGWDPVSLVRSPGPADGAARAFDLAATWTDDLLVGVGVLVHCAYDLTLTRPSDIARVNIGGTRRLLRAAVDADVPRVIVLSSMSAYEGTTQTYGRAKLAIEGATLQVGGCVLRPGLVYGDHPGGMVGALRRLVRYPVVPVPAGTARQFTVHEDDLVSVVAALAAATTVPTHAIGVADPDGIAFRDLLAALAAQEGTATRFVPVPWQPLYWGLRVLERLPMRLPFRADSLIGLVRPAPGVPGIEEVAALGVHPRAFNVERSGTE